MKKIIFTLVFSACFVGFSSAQFRLMNMNQTSDLSDDTQINEGDIITFNTAEYEAAKLKFLTYNDGESNMYVRVECEGLTNTDGSMMEVCYGACYTGIESFVAYPLDNPIYVEPGFHQGILADYFSNTDGNSDLVEYDFRFFQTDADGFEIDGTSFRFKYRYDGTMSVSDENSIAIAQVAPTVIKGQTNVTLKENASVQILNMEGKAIKSLKLNSGNSQIDFSGFSAGVYLIQFKGDSGLTTTKKVVVK